MQNYRHALPPIATPGSNAEVVIFQDGDGTTPSVTFQTSYTELDVAMKLSQDVTLIHKWGPTLTTADGSMAIINGATSTGETVTGGAFFNKTLQLFPGRNRISVVAGVTPPTATYIASALYSGPRVV